MSTKRYAIAVPGKPDLLSRHTSIWAAKQAAWERPELVEVRVKAAGRGGAWSVAIPAGEVLKPPGTSRAGG
jgi:hypothetical protein